MKKNLLSLFQIFDICLYFINDKERWITNFMLAGCIAVYSMGFVYWGSNVVVKMLAFNFSNGTLKIYLILSSFLLGAMLTYLITPRRNDFYNEYSKLESIILTKWFRSILVIVLMATSIFNIIVGVKFGYAVILVYFLELIIIPYGFFWFAKTQDAILSKKGPE